jgi:hypothetical protein
MMLSHQQQLVLPLMHVKRSMIEDYSVVYFGYAMFKIFRLLFLALFCVHFFACIFFAVKAGSATSDEDVTAFYTSRNVEEDVSVCAISLQKIAILLLCLCNVG